MRRLSCVGCADEMPAGAANATATHLHVTPDVATALTNQSPSRQGHRLFPKPPPPPPPPPDNAFTFLSDSDLVFSVCNSSAHCRSLIGNISPVHYVSVPVCQCVCQCVSVSVCVRVWPPSVPQEEEGIFSLVSITTTKKKNF